MVRQGGRRGVPSVALPGARFCRDPDARAIGLHHAGKHLVTWNDVLRRVVNHAAHVPEKGIVGRDGHIGPERERPREADAGTLPRP